LTGRSARLAELTVGAEGEENMSIEVMRSFLLWCAVINYGMLLVWFLVFVLAHDWLQRIHGRWFRLSQEQFDTLHYAGIALYKLGILLFNLVPWIALCIVS
jgi:hypothetical protein